MSINLTVLGCHSATPRVNANPTSQYLEINNRHFLIDCGEGTQVQLRKFKIKFARVKHIFISHLHGDHFFGLIGLISSFRLLGREADLHIYGPKGIKEAITLQLKLGKSWTNYNLRFHELESETECILFEDEKVTVSTIPLKHRIYTNGFLFREKEAERTLDIEAANKYKIEKAYFKKLKQGFDVVNQKGETISNTLVTKAPPAPKSYAYCSDTMYHPTIVPLLHKVTTLYHEATFLEAHKHLAEKTMHSTAKQAATIAKEANVGLLILGHYSGRYTTTLDFKTEAQNVFDEVHLAEDGKVFEI